MNDMNSMNFYYGENLIFGESSDSEEEESNYCKTTRRKLDEIPNTAKASKTINGANKKRVTNGNEIVLEKRLVNVQNNEPNTIQCQQESMYRLPVHSTSQPGFNIDLKKLIEKEMDLDNFVKKHGHRGHRRSEELMKSWGESYGDGWKQRLEVAFRKWNYFLKLVNKNGSNACFANVIVQAMISLGREFYELVYILSLRNLSNLKGIYHIIVLF